MKMNINHAIELRAGLKSLFTLHSVSEVVSAFKLYSILDGESFEAMDFSKLVPLTARSYGLFREGYQVPSRIYILNEGHSVSVYGR